jgi:transposase
LRLIKKIREKVDELAKSKKHLPIRLMFQDEAGFGRINKPKRCWCPKGCRPAVPCQTVREHTYAYAAVCPHDGAMVSLVLPYTNAVCMSLFLAEAARRHPNDYILMLVDCAAWHTAKTLEIPRNMELFALPPYSPELNPVEQIWDETREKGFKNEVFNSLSLVEDRLCETLFGLENDSKRVCSITGWDWIVSINLKAN